MGPDRAYANRMLPSYNHDKFALSDISLNLLFNRLNHFRDRGIRFYNSARATQRPVLRSSFATEGGSATSQSSKGKPAKAGKILYFLLVLVLISPLARTSNGVKSGLCLADLDSHRVSRDIWDSNKYISIDEVQPGMKAYCLTCYKGTEIEKFALDVISVVRNISPGRNAILVQSTDERFIHTGPIGGCSGSPVYIDGRLAGALAFAWVFSKDPLYGVTPIEEMLEVGRADDRRQTPEDKGQKANACRVGFVFDFSKPIDFAEIDKQITDPRYLIPDARRVSGIGNRESSSCPVR